MIASGRQWKEARTLASEWEMRVLACDPLLASRFGSLVEKWIGESKIGGQAASARPIDQVEHFHSGQVPSKNQTNQYAATTQKDNPNSTFRPRSCRLDGRLGGWVDSDRRMYGRVDG